MEEAVVAVALEVEDQGTAEVAGEDCTQVLQVVHCMERITEDLVEDLEDRVRMHMVNLILIVSRFIKPIPI